MNDNSFMFATANILSAYRLSLPTGKRVPRGWSAVPIGAEGEELTLNWPNNGSLESSTLNTQMETLNPLMESVRLRISIAVEMREEKRIEVYLLESNTVLGTIDIRFAYVFQPFELELTASQAVSAMDEGVGLRAISGVEPLWIFDDLGNDELRRSFTPHLVIGSDGRRMEHFHITMMSLASLQPFGWLEGCVLDGLYDMRRVHEPEQVDKVLELHLKQFIDDQGRLQYEDLFGLPSDGQFSGTESTLPTAIIAKINPHHPIVTQAVAFWMSNREDDGTISDGGTVTAEGTYTIGYPMAIAAVSLNNRELAQRAIEQVLIRKKMLTDGRDFYLVNKGKGQERLFRNWSRGYAWYMIGMTRIQLALLDSQFSDLEGLKTLAEETKRMAEVVKSWRQPEGLWNCFLDDPGTGIETSGSAGIAAALAIGAKNGLLSSEWLTLAEDCLHLLESYVTPDGLLAGVTQHNAGGEGLQRSGYRVLSQMGMGLMTQLYAAVHTSD